MDAFIYKPLAWNVIFGAGTIDRLGAQLDKLGLQKALILTTEGQSDKGAKLAASLGSRAAGHFDGAKMHVPVSSVDGAIRAAHDCKADCTVSLGGGSTTGLGKALALKADLPNITIPTTYAGSEMTNIWGITENERKVTGRDNSVVPNLIIYDPELTLSLPASIIGPSAINAMAQAVVNVATDKPNAMVSLMAEEAIRAISGALPKVMATPGDMEVRAQLLYGSSLAGAALGTGTTSLHHKLCHTFGGTFNTPHAETHTILLPHAVAYNAPGAPDGTGKVADAMGVNNAAQGIFQLARSVGAPTALSDIGVSYDDLDKAIDVALEMTFDNPVPVTKDRLRLLLENAYHGNDPLSGQG